MPDEPRPLTQLVITPSYPPIDSSVTLINIKIIEALERLGVRSVVLTVTPEDVNYTITTDLERIFHSNRSVYRLRTFEKGGKLLSIIRVMLKKTLIHYAPDYHYIWTINSIKSLHCIFKREKIDVIHSVSAPYASQIVGFFAKIISKKPWVCNLVDFWAAQPAEHFDRYRNLNYWLQDRCFEKADKIITSTKEIFDLTSIRYQEPIISKFECITPSFVPDHYPINYKKHFRKYVFTFLGVFYINKREPYTLFKALRELKEERPEIYRKIELNLVGIEPGKWQDTVNKQGIGEAVKLKPRVNYSESMRLMKEAGILVHIGYMSDKFPHDIHISGKLYEYLGAQRLILGLTTPMGPVADFIRKAGGVVADYNEPEEIKKAIIGITKRFSPRRLYRWKAPAGNEEYDVKRVAKRYMDIFNGMARPSGRSRTT